MIDIPITKKMLRNRRNKVAEVSEENITIHYTGLYEKIYKDVVEAIFSGFSKESLAFTENIEVYNWKGG